MRAVFVMLVLAAVAESAPLPTEAKDPYQWRILLRASNHPFLDDAFRERLARELKAALSPTVGPLGGVEVVDLATAATLDAIGQDFKARGLVALDPVANRLLDGVKHHGLTIEFKDGAFHLASRQYDGSTGMLSPLLRTRVVRTLDQVARIAALMLEPDFGTVGTVETILKDDQHVMLVLHSGALASIDNQVKRGDVFAVSLVRDAKPTGQTAAPIPGVLLRVVDTPADGKCRCKVLSKWATPFTQAARTAAGKRAMKLPAVTTPVSIRLVDRAGKPHTRSQNLVIAAGEGEFVKSAGPSDKFEWRDGLYRSLRPFHGVACVSIGVGLEKPQLFPLAVLNDDVLTLAFDINAEAERRAEYLRDCTDLRLRVAVLFETQYANTAALNKFITAGQFKEALTRAEAGRDTLTASESAYGDELKQLREQKGATDPDAKRVLEACEGQLLAVKDGVAQLVTTIASLKEAVAKAGSGESIERDLREQLLIDRIRDLEKRGDIPDAIDVFTQLIALCPAKEGYKDAREKLRAEWAPKDDAHRAARDCIRLLNTAKHADEFRTALEAVRKSVPVLKLKKDKLGLRKLGNSYEPALAAFKDVLEAYERMPNGEDKVRRGDELREIQQNFEQMGILTRETIRELAANR